MSRTTRPLTPDFFKFRVLIEFDKAYGYYAGYCLETGTVVTADDAETAGQMMEELLTDEVSFAWEHEDLKNLYSSPAPSHVWVRWYEIAEKQEPRQVQLSICTNRKINNAEPRANVDFNQAEAE